MSDATYDRLRAAVLYDDYDYEENWIQGFSETALDEFAAYCEARGRAQTLDWVLEKENKAEWWYDLLLDEQIKAETVLRQYDGVGR